VSAGKPVSVLVAEALGWTETHPPVLAHGEWKGRPPRYLGLGSDVRDIPHYHEPQGGAPAIAHLILLLAAAGKLPKVE
jgi:hypothetical protein